MAWPRCVLAAACLLAASAPRAVVADGSNDGGGGGEPKRLRVAVIGGGIAGSATALELLRHKHVDVTVFEQAGQIGHNQSASGIIAALTVFNSKHQYWHSAETPEELQDFVAKQILSYRLSNLNFRGIEFAQKVAIEKTSDDIRNSKEYKQKFNAASRLRFEEQLDLFPEMCGAIVGPYCCREGSRARAWVDKQHGKAHGVTCSGIKRGLSHTWLHSGWSAANEPELAAKGGWELASPQNDSAGHLNDTRHWLREEHIKGILWNEVDEGFVRVESLYPILTDIFRKSGRVHLALNCNVGSLKASPPGIEVVAPGCNASGVYDRVIVAGGANSVNILADQDEAIMTELLPVKGFAAVTQEKLMRKDQLDMGVLVEDLSHYIRPTLAGGVAYGFGKELGTFDDELLQPRYRDWKAEGPAATGLGREVLNQTDVKRLSGMRPMSAWIDFPLLKRYKGKWDGLILNTGYGFYGYTLAWKSSQLAADIAVTGQLSDDQLAASVDLYDGCGAQPCWVYKAQLILGFLAGSVVLPLLIVACCCCCGCCGCMVMKTKKEDKGSGGGMRLPLAAQE